MQQVQSTTSRRADPARRAAIQAEALDRATSGQALTNYPAIFEGFKAKGIPEHEINPRENVFTFNAWKALGRSVKKGEHGVKVVTFVQGRGAANDDGSDAAEKRRPYRFPRSVTVFHVSQTEPSREFVQ